MAGAFARALGERLAATSSEMNELASDLARLRNESDQ